MEEGEAELIVPQLEKYKTSDKEYVPSKTPVFFNPVMEITRDISVSSLQVLGEDIDGLRICDALAGVGARGIRYSKELKDPGEIVINDRDEEAVDLIRRNIERNELESAVASEEDANALLSNHRPRFHAIDLDPFGTPVPFLDSAFSAISRRGMLFVTATDTAPLCGAYPKPCLRKYGAKPLRISYSRELGLRILIGTVQRRGATYDLSLSPVLSHATQHFFRVHFKVDQGAKKADKLLKKQGYISHCSGCGRRYATKGLVTELPQNCDCGRKLAHSGPMWLGEFGEKDHLRKVIEDISTRNFDLGRKERDLLRSCLNEAEGPPTFYDIHEISSKLGTSPPKLDLLVNRLKERNFFVSKTHFSGTGLRTDAPMETLVEIIPS